MNTLQPQSGREIKKYFKRIFWIFLSLILFFFCFDFFISWFYKNKVKDIFLTEINKYLQAETGFSDFNLSLLEKFPNASFQFYNVVAKDATPQKKDTLLKAKILYLQFNIFDLIDKKYIIKNIELKDGFSRVKVYQDGSDNYHCWKTMQGKSDKSFELDLKKIVLKLLKMPRY